MVTPGTLYRFRRNDLIAALERVPQQVRPAGFRRMDKGDLFFAVLRIVRELPDVAEMVWKMAERLERR